ncbi:Cell division control protein 15 [Smittium culicis]|uniref:Cell division control protein 15 n=1 Tax=Smittium culicis TaxID=133412 RepID=A0A1R1YI15_9FUNG|nr:Cell division control protein 15 [Smittium culicis]
MNLITTRAQLEEEYGKKLLKLSKASLGSEEIGTIKNSLLSVRKELEVTGKAHVNLASEIRKEIEQPLSSLIAQQRQQRKTTRDKLRNDTKKSNDIEQMIFRTQGMADQKLKLKHDKARALVASEESNLIDIQNRLTQADYQWQGIWKTACDVFQILEEKRMESIKSFMWSYANLFSGVCVSDDDAMERIRVELEQQSTQDDTDKFVSMFGTGKPDFEDESAINQHDENSPHNSNPTFSNNNNNDNDNNNNNNNSSETDHDYSNNNNKIEISNISKEQIDILSQEINNYSLIPKNSSPSSTPISLPINQQDSRNVDNRSPINQTPKNDPSIPQNNRRYSNSDYTQSSQSFTPNRPASSIATSPYINYIKPTTSNPVSRTSFDPHSLISPNSNYSISNPINDPNYPPNSNRAYSNTPNSKNFNSRAQSMMFYNKNDMSPQISQNINQRNHLIQRAASSMDNSNMYNNQAYSVASPIQKSQYPPQSINNTTDNRGSRSNSRSSNSRMMNYTPQQQQQQISPMQSMSHSQQQLLLQQQQQQQQQANISRQYQYQQPDPNQITHQPSFTPKMNPSKTPNPQSIQYQQQQQQPQDDSKPILMYVRALYDYDAESPEELSLTENNVISVLTTNMDGWWEGEITDPKSGNVRRGLFPSNFTEPVSF